MRGIKKLIINLDTSQIWESGQGNGSYYKSIFAKNSTFGTSLVAKFGDMTLVS